MSHFAIFCLQNRSSFGKNQLLNAPTLVNQNKNKQKKRENSKSSNFKHTLRAKRAKRGICLQNGASFGKNQLLNAPTLVNQNKNKKKARKFEIFKF